EVGDFDLPVLAVFQLPMRRSALLSAKSRPAEAEQAVPDFSRARDVDLPTAAIHLDAAVVVPSPWPRDPSESRPSIAVFVLEHGSDVGRNQIGGGGRIAIMQNANRARFGGAGLKKGGVEGIHLVARIFEVLRKWLRTTGASVIDPDFRSGGFGRLGYR